MQEYPRVTATFGQKVTELYHYFKSLADNRRGNSDTIHFLIDYHKQVSPIVGNTIELALQTADKIDELERRIRVLEGYEDEQGKEYS